MSRTYSEEFRLNLYKSPNESLGYRLAKACVEANIAMTHIAVPLGVSRLTVFNWFRGKPIREESVPIVEALLRIMERDTVGGTLPVRSLYASRAYTESLGIPSKEVRRKSRP